MQRILATLFMLVLFGVQAVWAQKVADYRCVLFNEKMQKLNFSDSTLNFATLFNAKEISVYLSGKKDPKAKLTLLEVVVSVVRINENIAEFTIAGNKIKEGNDFYAELKQCMPEDKIYIDHLVFKTAAGQTLSFNKGFVFVLK